MFSLNVSTMLVVLGTAVAPLPGEYPPPGSAESNCGAVVSAADCATHVTEPGLAAAPLAAPDAQLMVTSPCET